MALIFARVNGQKIAFNGCKHLARYLLMNINFNNYVPLKTRVENVVKILHLSEFPKKARWVRDYVDNEEKFRRVFWNLTLEMQNLGTLPGFSVKGPIELGRSNYNPEHIRISRDWNQYESEM